jgi:hypothetical protein
MGGICGAYGSEANAFEFWRQIREMTVSSCCDWRSFGSFVAFIRRQNVVRCWRRSLKERDHLKDLGIHGGIMLKLDLQESGGSMGNVDQIHLSLVCFKTISISIATDHSDTTFQKQSVIITRCA